MKILSLLVGAALLVAPVLSFPTMIRDLNATELEQFRELADKIAVDLKARDDPLNNRATVGGYYGIKVQNTGKYAWKAPGPKDIRGTCPGLNILANHGYISRTGVDTVPAIIAASQQVFGMALDLGTFLAVYAAVIAGDLVTVSIGGAPNNTGLLSSIGLVGAPKGLSNSHNRFECDNSPTRSDLYFNNDPVSLDIERFTSLYNSGPGPNGYDLSIMLPHRQKYFRKSVEENPYYFNGPFTGMAIQTATFIFTYRFFASYNTGTLDGYLSGEHLKSFEGVSGKPGNFAWKSGYERIPDDWYRRPANAEYGIPNFIVDAGYTLSQVPDLFALGGNTGKPNSFVGVNLTDLTGGTYNAGTLMQGNNLMCFVSQSLSAVSADMIKGLLSNVANAVSMLDAVLSPIISTLGCPQLAKYDVALFDQFPGAKGAFS